MTPELKRLIEAAQPIFDQIKTTVQGWHAHPGHERHPLELRTTLESNCGTFYAIADALAALDAAPDAGAQASPPVIISSVSAMNRLGPGEQSAAPAPAPLTPERFAAPRRLTPEEYVRAGIDAAMRQCSIVARGYEAEKNKSGYYAANMCWVSIDKLNAAAIARAAEEAKRHDP